MMNEKENFMAMLHGEKPEYVPYFGLYCKACIMPGDPESQANGFPGTDGFGIPWSTTKEGNIPTPGVFAIEDMENWKDTIHFPDLNKYDYKAISEVELADYKPDEQVLYLINGIYGPFSRLNALMGFENALISIASEQEEIMEFCEAWAEYEIERIDRFTEYYHPDVAWFFDDIATTKSLFLSPDAWRELFKPASEKVIKHMISKGINVAFHCCGKCDDVVEDFAAMGCRIWNSAQIMNDINGIQKKYGSRLLIEGGWDCQGIPGTVAATADDFCAEVKRCLSEYGQMGNFILMPITFTEKGNSFYYGDDRLAPMIQTYYENRMII